MKDLRFIGSQTDLAAFPEDAKREAGFDLWQVQLGLILRDFKPMPTVGAGAYEVRVKIKDWSLNHENQSHSRRSPQ